MPLNVTQIAIDSGSSFILPKIPKHSIILVGKSALQDNNSAVVRLYDPWTWSWLGLKLAEGAVAFIGGKIFQTIFFPDASNNQVIDALSTKIDEAVQRLQSYIDARLETQLVDIAKRKNQSLYALMREEANAPGSDPSRPSRVNAEARENWDLLFNRGAAAILPACHAASLKMMALTTLFKATGNRGELLNIIDFSEMADASIVSWALEIEAKNSINVSNISYGDCVCELDSWYSLTTDRNDVRRREEVPPHFRHHCSISATIIADGQTITVHGSDSRSSESTARHYAIEECQRNAQAKYNEILSHQTARWTLIRDEVLMPAHAIVSHFREAGYAAKRIYDGQ